MSWRVYVLSPRKKGGNYRLRAHCTAKGVRPKEQTLKGVKDRAAAEAEARAVEAELNGGAAGQVLTISDVLDARLAEIKRQKHRGPRAGETSEQAAKRIKPLVGQILVSEFTRADAIKLQSDLVQKLAVSTALTTIAVLAAAWRWCEELGSIDKPWPRYRKAKRPKISGKRPMTPSEVQAIINFAASYIGGRYEGLFNVLADTGARITEIVSLAGRDVDYKTGALRLIGKGQIERVVPVTQHTLGLLPSVEPHEYVFGCYKSQLPTARPDRSRPCRRQTAYRVFRLAVKELGIKDGHRIDLHSFRRAFAANSTRAGVPIDVARRVTGHATRAMFDHYQKNAVGDDLRKVVESIRSERIKTTTKTTTKPQSEDGRTQERALQKKDCAGHENDKTVFYARVGEAHQSPESIDSTQSGLVVESGELGAVGGILKPASLYTPTEAEICIGRWLEEDPALAWAVLSDDDLLRRARDWLRREHGFGTDGVEKVG